MSSKGEPQPRKAMVAPRVRTLSQCGTGRPEVARKFEAYPSFADSRRPSGGPPDIHPDRSDHVAPAAQKGPIGQLSPASGGLLRL